MRRIIGILLLVSLLNACSSVSGKYVAIANGDSFVLPATYTQSGANTFGVEYVHGLAKGKYIAVGKDDNGTYYRGPSQCVILLINELALRYRQDGRIPTMQEKAVKMPGMFSGVEGGVYVPHSSKDKPSYYYYQDGTAMTGESDPHIPPSPSGSAPEEELSTEQPTVVLHSPMTRRQAYNTAARATGSNNTEQNATGASLGLDASRVIGQAGLRGMQGNILLGGPVDDPRIIEALGTVVR